MDNFQRDIINLINSSLIGSNITLSEDFDWEKAYSFGIKHQIIPLIFYGIINSDIVLSNEIFEKFEVSNCFAVNVNVNQTLALEEMYKYFEEQGISYIPLKGIVLKNLYPKLEMRQMSDADILIKTDEYSAVKKIMLSLGFENVDESDHEYIWQKGKLINIELHKRLIPSYNEDYYSYFGDGWQKAQKSKSSRYEFSDEDNFIYLFTHYAKHFRDGGIGIRHITDFFVFLKEKQELNISYIEDELKKLKLLDFYKNTIKVLDVWFGGKTGDNITDFMTDRIFRSGAYGTQEASMISKAVGSQYKNNVKARFGMIFSMVFPSFKNMCIRYSFLKKAPFLLPILWVVRLFRIVFKRRGGIKHYAKGIQFVTDENMTKYYEELKLVGLIFDLKE